MYIPRPFIKSIGLPYSSPAIIYYGPSSPLSPSSANTWETVLTNTLKKLNVEVLYGNVTYIYHEVYNPTTTSQTASTRVVLYDVYGNSYTIDMISSATVGANSSTLMDMYVVSPPITKIEHQVNFSSTSLQLSTVVVKSAPSLLVSRTVTVDAQSDDDLIWAVTVNKFGYNTPIKGGLIVFNLVSDKDVTMDVITDVESPNNILTWLSLKAGDKRNIVPINVLFNNTIDLKIHNPNTAAANIVADIIIFATTKDELFIPI